MLHSLKRLGSTIGQPLRKFQRFTHAARKFANATSEFVVTTEQQAKQVAALRTLAAKNTELTEDLLARYIEQTSEISAHSPLKRVGGVWLPQNDIHFAQFLSDGEKKYQFDVLSEAIARCKNLDVAIDIGAHIGLWSLHLSERFGEVHAFEPHPLHACCFLLNVPAGGVTLTSCALGAEPACAELVTLNNNSGDTYMKQSFEGPVIVRRLDDFGIRNVSFIKIDAQGAEIDVLRGARKTIESYMPIILAEDYPPSNEIYGAPQGEIAKFLEPLGYRNPEKIGRKDLLFAPA